jgi:hypothetical protein
MMTIIGKIISSIKNIFTSKPNLILHGPCTYSIDVVGESNYQNALMKICGGYTKEGHNKTIRAHLIHEDSNPYDNKAIRIDIQGMTVGYLSRTLAREFRKQLFESGYPGKPASCNAIIVGGWDRGKSDKGHFGVRLDLPEEPKRIRNKKPNEAG